MSFTSEASFTGNLNASDLSDTNEGVTRPALDLVAKDLSQAYALNNNQLCVSRKYTK